MTIRNVEESVYDDNVTETISSADVKYPVSNIANSVEVLFMIYKAFEDNFQGTDVHQNYNGSHLYIRTANGQVCKVTIAVLDERQLKEYNDYKHKYY